MILSLLSPFSGYLCLLRIRLYASEATSVLQREFPVEFPSARLEYIQDTSEETR